MLHSPNFISDSSFLHPRTKGVHLLIANLSFFSLFQSILMNHLEEKPFLESLPVSTIEPDLYILHLARLGKKSKLIGQVWRA